MTESYLEIFQLLLAKGMTHAEAMNEFDHRAIGECLLSDDSPPEQKRKLLVLMGKGFREESNQKDLESQAIPLWLAGWTSEPGTPPRDVFSWQWRAPAKGKRTQGRKYLSTQQAFNAWGKLNKGSV